jgi:hypothetical protein
MTALRRSSDIFGPKFGSGFSSHLMATMGRGKAANLMTLRGADRLDEFGTRELLEIFLSSFGSNS